MSTVHAALRIQRQRLSDTERTLAAARHHEKNCEQVLVQRQLALAEFRQAAPERERAFYHVLWGCLVKLIDLDEVAAQVAALKSEGVGLEMQVLEAEKELAAAQTQVEEKRVLYAAQAARTEKYVDWVRRLDEAQQQAIEQAEEAEQMEFQLRRNNTGTRLQ